jgi:AcrR family transcriptional regulator
MIGATTTRRAGRPRDPGIDDAILTATIRLLSSEGYGGLSVDGIAAAAGVSKAAIYRRWPSKNAVIVAAAEHLSQTVPVPDNGDLRADLEAIVTELVHVFAQPTTVRLVAALVAGMADDSEFARALRTGFLRVRRDATRVVLERAGAHGEINLEIDHRFAIDLLAAPLYYRLLITADPIDDRFAKQIVDAAMAWIATAQQHPDGIDARGTGTQSAFPHSPGGLA